MARKSKRLPAVQENLSASKNVYSVGIYLRLSIEEKRDIKDSESIEYQKQISLDYLKDKDDMILHGIYCDDGKTGTNFEREAFQKLMFDVYNGDVNCIIVKDFSRFGREYIESGEYLEKIFPLLGVRFIAVNEPYDNKVSPLDISVPIKNVINSMYAKDLSKKSATALRLKQLNGEYIGGPAPYGYLKSKEDKHILVVDDEIAPIIQQIFEWKRQRIGNVAICRKLFEMGIAPPSKYKYEKGLVKNKKYANIIYWSDTTITQILRNQVYIGNMVQGKTKSHFFDGMPTERVNREEWIVVENTHEAIISKELFYEVQAIMDEQKDRYFATHKKTVKKNDENIFKGKVVCGDCGKRVKRFKNAKNIYYACSHHLLYPSECSFTSINEKILKDVVFKSIKMQMTCLINLHTAIETALQSAAVKQKMFEMTSSISGTLSNIAYIKEGRINLTKDFANQKLSEEEYEIVRQELQNELEQELELLEKLNKQREKFKKLFTAEKWISDMKKHTTSKKLKADMVNAFVKQICIYPDKRIEIQWLYTEMIDEYSALLKGGDKVA